MSLAEILVLAFALSLDACAVAMASRATGRMRGKRSAIRLSFHFGLFQFLMPVAGWAMGVRVLPYIEAYDHWVAFALLAAVGGRMIHHAIEDTPEKQAADPSKGLLMVSLAIATSIDALAVGFGLAAMNVSAWYPCAIIGVVTMCMSILAVLGGKHAGEWLGTQAQIAGGIILILIGARIVYLHIG